jgi:acyl carrier protein
MGEEITCNKVVDIICQKFNRSSDILLKMNWDKPLTGEPLYLSDVEMVYLLFELEKQYGKRMNEKDLDDYAYCTINNIVNIMESMQ